ncbi:hypothetical protein CYY_008709 [Polysphondylium violaceum]|uniref:ABC transporter C family protein n=1 Tax=Polysphondylium violaceum TaxID=133409 RepID=A0A8J4PUR9_9MYCE|nr:hypothetical protein CYY_008709 [Polysphondylium violaceum]
MTEEVETSMGDTPQDIPMKEMEKKKKEKVKKPKMGWNGEDSPEENSFFLFKLTFDWANPFIWFCYRNVLELHHIWNLATYDRAETLSRKIAETWKVELTRPKPSYMKAAIRAFGLYFAISWIFYAIYAASQFVGPELLSRMVKFVIATKTGTSTEDPNMGYYYALAMFGSAMIGSFCLYQSNMISARTGDWLRSIIVCDVYKKALKLSNSSKSNTSPGEIVNLMSNDAQRMVEVFLLVNNGLFAIPQIAVSIGLLYRAIGWPTFVGFGLMIFAVPLNGIAAKKLTEVRRNMIKHTDARVKTTNEILQAIKIIKLYAWENSFARKVNDRRDEEVKMLFSFSHYRAFLIIVVAALPTAVSVLVFSTYYGYYKELDAANIFSSLAYLNILRMPLGFLPIIIALLAQLYIAAGRITNFLLLSEIKPLKESTDPNKEVGVYVNEANFSWNAEKPESFELKNINGTFSGPTLTMVVGSVGSGKSSFCQSILGEMDLKSGDLEVKGNIAYVSQQAWIINATLRENILFGKEYDEEKYQKVLDVCALKRDIELFPAGDMVEIGERGVNLSGGQKQRVSIARAVYSDSDIYILDDPLSAVDAHVGKHLFHKCFNGILKGKTIILAANQLNFLPYCDKALVLKGGEIVEQGNYKQIISSGSDFAIQLANYGVDEISEKEEVEEVEEKGKHHHHQQPEKLTSEGIEIKEMTKQTDKQEIKNEDGNLIQQEERETGSVGLNVYWKYFKSGGVALFVTSIALFLGDTGVRTFCDWWLSHWSNAANSRQVNPNYQDSLSNNQYLYIYIGIGVFSVIVSGFRNFVYFDYTVRCSKVIHDKLFSALLRAPMWFFDVTPLGRIINRFTRDLDGIDNLIAAAVSQYITFFATVVATLIIISIITPYLLIPLAPIIIIFYFLQYFYRFTSRELQRLESISRSPIFAHFSETLNGVTTIRAYKKIESNILANQQKLDNNNKCYLTLQAMNQWLGLRLDFLGNLVIFFACLFVTIDKGTIEAASVGLSLSYSLSITANLNRATLQAADTETKMNSVERIYHYIKGPVEAEQIKPDCRPAPEWPSKGGIVFDNLIMRYREGLDPVLRGISCEIRPQEKVGIVGRTGAGKSSIVLALFRLVESSEGQILIDGEDISKFGLHDLRRNLSIIPQDPVLFSGTLRDNLDPFKESSDDSLWELLEQIQLKATVQGLEGGLECKVTENGENWSVGQRQLICLGRALLRKPKILVLDEATASVDSHTDSLIQRTVREQFKSATILTIAHRLNTIMDSDRIMVLDAGRVSEFDSPYTLLQNPTGLLSWLVDETGPQNSIFLRKLAKAKYDGVELPANISSPNLESLNTPIQDEIDQRDLMSSSSSSSSSNSNSPTTTSPSETQTTTSYTGTPSTTD